MKVYISGPIDGIDDYRKIFLRTEEHLTDQGLEVVNPVTVGDLLLLRNPELKNLTKEDLYKAYMKEDIKELLECDAIFMIMGWEESKGAKFENETAIMCGIEIMYGAHI